MSRREALSGCLGLERGAHKWAVGQRLSLSNFLLAENYRNKNQRVKNLIKKEANLFEQGRTGENKKRGP